MKIETTIYMEPVGKGRPRMAVKGGRSFVYTPKTTVHAENIIRDSVINLEQFYQKDMPLKLEATFYRSRPKSLKKSIVYPVTRPDWDNLAKLLMDALEKFIYANDSQVVTAIIRKRFGLPPRIELKIEIEGG